MASRLASTVLRKAREGDLDAQVSAGRLYLEGAPGLRRDSAAALYWLRTAAERGSTDAQDLIGRAIPAASVKDPGTLVGYYESASDGGSADAGVALSDWALTGRIPGADSRAYELLRRAAVGGDRKAELRLAILLESGALGVERVGEAMRWYEKAAAQGSRAAAISLANCHWARADPAVRHSLDRLADATDEEILYRRAVLQVSEGELRSAAAALEEAASRGHPAAQLAFGLLHWVAVRTRLAGVPHGLKKAAAWLERASRSGLAQASFELYRLFRRPEFSRKNASAAYRYLETAAHQGHAHAQFLVATLRLRDALTLDADVAAARWIARAAKQGHAEASALAGLLYGRRRTSLFADPVELTRLAALLARSRVALATRLELAAAFGLSGPEMLLIDPAVADRGECLVVDIRRELPRARRRILLLQGVPERATLDRARRLLSARAPHPTDVRGPYSQRKLDFEHTLTLLGSRASVPPLRP